jgi:hypothetical protein
VTAVGRLGAAGEGGGGGEGGWPTHLSLAWGACLASLEVDPISPQPIPVHSKYEAIGRGQKYQLLSGNLTSEVQITQLPTEFARGLTPTAWGLNPHHTPPRLSHYLLGERNR